jgi:uncharacterized protein (TIGR02284 family)
MINDYEATRPITADIAGGGGFGPTAGDANEELVSTLNGLIETCKNGQEGFTQAADGVDDGNLQTLFREYAFRRSQYVGELQSLVQTLGGDPENSGSVAGALHRGWLNIKAAVTGGGSEAVLDECERGEDVAKEAYKNALEMNLPDYIREVVENQYQGVLAAHDNIKALRNTADDRSSTASSNR